MASTSHLSEPSRRLVVDWGELRASCGHPDRVQFNTYLSDTGDSSSLLIHRVHYRFAIVLERGDLPLDRRHSALHVDKTWYLDRSSSWSLRRIEGHSEATATAEGVVRQQVLPTLATWLGTDDAHALLAEGRHWWRTDFQQRTVEVEDTLKAALQRVLALRVRAAGGEIVGADDERYLRTVRLHSY